MCKKLKFDHTNKWYMHNPASVQENDTHKLLWNFDIYTDHLISARRPDLIIIHKKKKRIWKIVNFAVTADHRIKLKESEKKNKYIDLARELKKLWNMNVTIIPIVIGAFGTVTKWPRIVRCLQHRAKTISSDTDAYQEEMISLRYNLHRNNYPERITSAPRNLDRRIEDNTRKLTTVCLPYVKGLAERIQKICCPYEIRTVFTSGSTLRRYLFRVKPPTEFNMTKNCVYPIPCSCGKIYKSETGRPLKVSLEEHR